jgi:hypothetical protein
MSPLILIFDCQSETNELMLRQIIPYDSSPLSSGSSRSLHGVCFMPDTSDAWQNEPLRLR